MTEGPRTITSYGEIVRCLQRIRSEVRDGAIGQHPHHLEDGENVAFALFDLRALVAMPAVFHVQRMQVVALGEVVEFFTRRIRDIVPFHLFIS